MRFVVAVAVVVAAALAGCFDPFRVHVDESVFGHSSISWTVTELPQKDDGFLGSKYTEQRYVFLAQSSPQGAGPPFSGYLFVLGARWNQNPSTQALVDEMTRLVESTLHTLNITVDASKSAQGARTLANGLRTQWVVREGTVAAGGGVFPERAVVRVLGEVGMDGISDTAVLSIGYVQIERRTECPILAACQPVRDLVTWIDVVGDPLGTITGATNRYGLEYNLVTH